MQSPKNLRLSKIFVATGDPFGIGYEIIIKALKRLRKNPFEITIGGDPDFFEKKLKDFKINLGLKNIFVEKIHKIRKEKNYPSKEGAKYSIDSLNWAIEKVLKEKGILFTGPVSKGMIRKIMPDFRGQTEYICEKINVNPSDVIMTFYFKEKFIGLFTQHIPLRDVFKSLNPESYLKRLSIFKKELKKILKKNPKIALLSLNPHSEEFGKEEKILKKYIKFGKNLKGFFPTDSFFGYELYKKFDGIFAFYHDQATTSAKILGPSVHLTLGLPFLRISPDHGPAYNMKGKADFGSTIECFEFVRKYFTIKK